MNCPHCNVPLLMSERKGVEIDYCGQCRGVWLDRGELDKIIELTLAERQGSGAQRPSHGQAHDRGYRQHKPYHRYKKKKSLLGEVFDIFD